MPCIDIGGHPVAAWLRGMDQLFFLLVRVSSGAVDLSVLWCRWWSCLPTYSIFCVAQTQDCNGSVISVLLLFHSSVCFNTLMCLPGQLCVFVPTHEHQIAKLLRWIVYTLNAWWSWSFSKNRLEKCIIAVQVSVWNNECMTFPHTVIKSWLPKYTLSLRASYCWF